MRTPAQTQKGVEQDLRHLQTAYDRARNNPRREAKLNKRILAALKLVIMTYQSEKFSAKAVPPPPKSGRRPIARSVAPKMKPKAAKILNGHVN